MTAAIDILPRIDSLDGFLEGDVVTAAEIAEVLDAVAGTLAQRGEPEQAARCWEMVARLADSPGQHRDAVRDAERVMEPSPRHTESAFDLDDDDTDDHHFRVWGF